MAGVPLLTADSAWMVVVMGDEALWWTGVAMVTYTRHTTQTQKREKEAKSRNQPKRITTYMVKYVTTFRDEVSQCVIQALTLINYNFSLIIAFLELLLGPLEPSVSDFG